MRKSTRIRAQLGAEERLVQAIASVPAPVQRALAQVAAREDLLLVSGHWTNDDGGCLVANVVRAHAGQRADAATFDLQILELIPEMSSRDLNRLVVAWDEAALQLGTRSDAALRRLLRAALLRAGVAPVAVAT